MGPEHSRKDNEPKPMYELRGEIQFVMANAFQAVLNNFSVSTDDGRTTPDGEAIGDLRNFITGGMELALTIKAIDSRVRGSGPKAIIALYASEATAALSERKEDFTREEIALAKDLLVKIPVASAHWTPECTILLRTLLGK